MLAYILLLSLPFVLLVFIRYLRYQGIRCSDDTEHRILLIAFFVGFVLLLSLRDTSVGADLNNYLTKYHRIASQNLAAIWKNRGRVEIGYALVNKLLALIGLSERAFIVVISVLMIGPVAWLYSKESDNWMLTVSLYLTLPVFSICFSGLRQALALAIVPFAYYFTKRRKLIWFIVMVLLAFSFHTSAVFIALLYPVYRMRVKKKWLLVVIPVMAIFYVFNTQLYTLVISIMGSKFEERYSDVSGTGAYTMLILFIIFAAYSFFIADEELMDDEAFGLRNILLLTVALQFFAPVNSIAMRVNYYFLLLVPIAVPRMILLYKQKYRKIAIVSLYLMAVFFYGYFLLKAYKGHDVLHLYPYVSLWGKA